MILRAKGPFAGQALTGSKSAVAAAELVAGKAETTLQAANAAIKAEVNNIIFYFFSPF